MTIGDVLAAMGAVFLVGAGWAATLLLVALAFPERVRRAGEATVAAPGVCLARGAGIAPHGRRVRRHARPSGGGAGAAGRVALWAGLGLAAALGSAGIVSILGERIREVGTEMPPFAALTRGTALYVLAGLLPVVGWFLITPLALLLSLGGAFAALRPARAGSGHGKAPLLPQNWAPGGDLLRESGAVMKRRHFLGLGAAAMGAALLNGCETVEQRLTKQAPAPRPAAAGGRELAVARRARPEPRCLRPAPR